MHFFTSNFGYFEQFGAYPHLRTLQFVTIWRSTQNMFGWAYYFWLHLFIGLKSFNDGLDLWKSFSQKNNALSLHKSPKNLA